MKEFFLSAIMLAERKIKIIIGFLTLMLALSIFSTGANPKDNFIMGDPFFLNKTPAFIRAPLISRLTVVIIILNLVIFGITKMLNNRRVRNIDDVNVKCKT